MGVAEHTYHWYQYISQWLIDIRGKRISVCGLSVHDSHRLKAQSYLHATYLSGSICVSGLSFHDSHRLKAQSYLHATYSDGSICVSGLLVHTVTDYSHRAITMLLILVEVSVNVACPSTTVMALWL